MHMLIIGGNGRTGRLVIAEALRREHTVTALIRDTSTLQPQTGLTIVKGSPLVKEDIARAFNAATATPSAVIITLNAPRATDSPFAPSIAPPRMMSDANANAVAMMKIHGVSKIVTMSAFGAGDSFNSLNCMLKLLFRKSNMAVQFEDHDAVDRQLKESEMDFVLVRPATLAEGGAKAVNVMGDKGSGVRLFSKITRESVATFMVDAAEKDEWNRSTPVIIN